MQLILCFKNIVKFVRRAVEAESIFVSLMLFFHISIVIQSYSYQNLESEIYIRIAKVVFYLFPNLLLITALASIYHALPWRNVRFAFEFITLFVIGIIAISDTFLLHLYGSVLDQAKIEAVLETDYHTWYEFLFFYVFKWDVIVFIAALALLLVAVFHLAQYIRFKQLLSLIVAVILPFSIIVSCVSLSYIASMGVGGWIYRYGYMHFPVLRVIVEINRAHDALGSDAANKASLDKMIEQENVSASEDTPTIVYILGESTDRNHMSIYGYNLPTTPHLTEREKSGELAVFTDTIAPGNNTGRVMALTFNNAGKEHGDKWFDYPNLIDVMKKGGYHTYWISNQEITSSSGNFDKIFSDRSDESYFIRYNGGANGTGLTSIEYDESILPPLDAFKSKAADKSFYVLHLIGCHEIFRWRYPDKFSLFTEADEPGPKKTWKKVQAEYDNAVLYDDFVVNEIIKRFENENAIIFFISDHGMDLYDTGEIAGHTDEKAGSRHMIEVPFIIWASQKYRTKYPETWKKMLVSVNRPYRTDELFHTILDAAGIRTTSFDPSKSIFNDKFKPIERIYSGKLYHRLDE